METMVKPYTVVHQMQMTDTSCVPACIAMVTGFSQGGIISQMASHGGSSGSLREEFRQWVRMGYLPRLLPYNELIDGKRRVMLATVPSLNILGGNHRIVIDYTDPEEGPTILDPNDGREGKLFYTMDNIRSWSELTVVDFVY